MFKNIKELLNLKKSLEEKRVALNQLENRILAKDHIWQEIVDQATKEANEQAAALIAESQNKLTHIEQEIANKDTYLSEVEEIKAEYDKIAKQVESQRNKLSRIKSLYKGMEHAIDKFFKADAYIHELKLPIDEVESAEDYAPTVTLKLHCMDLKELKKAFNENNRLITKTLEKYQSRYTTKANAAIYELMVIALRSELQNILYNLKYDKLEKSIEDIKTITQKYLSIASNGNQSIAPTLVKFIGEIEHLFIEAAKIEYEYYIQKEKQKEEQAMLREQMRQDAEDRRILEQQKKQVEKEEEKYKNEIAKVEELLSSTTDDAKLKQLQDKIAELQLQLDSVEHKKEEIVSRQNGKAGYVYVISNLGSFGENVFKIGMTRRLDPQDRVNELGDASVPFPFDVHSFIFSDDAVNLEQELHNILNDRRVNKVNLRKEFFNISIDELEQLVTKINPSAEFNITMLAEQYRQTLSLIEDDLAV